MDKVGVAILAGLGIVAVMIVLALFGAFTIATLWGWFITPFGIQAIGMAHAYGLSIFATLLQGTRGLNSGTDSGTLLVQGLVLNILSLAFGGIAVQFM